MTAGPAPGVSPADLDITGDLQQSLLARLQPVAWGLSGLYVLLGLAHLFMLQPAAWRIMTPLSWGSALFYVLFATVARRQLIPARLADAAGFVLVTPAILNVHIHLLATGTLESSENAGILIIAIGILMGSARWAATAALLVLAGWAVLARLVPESDELRDYAFMLGEMTLVGALAWVTRARFERASLLAQRREGLRAREAEAAMAARGQFLAVMSHEIRTPLSGVLGVAELLAGTPLTPHQRRLTDALQAAAEASSHLLSDILDISKIEQGQLTLEQIPFRLSQLVDVAEQQFHPLADRKNLGFAIGLAGPAPEWVAGDPLRLQQILTNLLSNALKFTDAGSIHVKLSAAPLGSGRCELRMEVADTGIGMSPDVQSRLFQPFVQADASTTRLYGGSGLGLSICRHLVSLMGGRLGVESEPGRGSRIWVHVPLMQASAPADQPPPVDSAPSPSAAAPGRTLTVLIADDVELNRFLVLSKVKSLGHNTREAMNGAEALAIAAQGGIDLILMDLHMPVMDGATATRQIRALPPPAGQVPIFALTADAVEEHRALYLDAGLNDFFTKPIDWSRLAPRIATVAAGQPLAASGDDGTEARPVPAAEAERLLDQGFLAEMRQTIGDHGLKQLMDQFGQTLGAQAAALTAAYDARDSGLFLEEAHRLKGTALSCGALKLGLLAGGLEERGLGGAGQDLAGVRGVLAATLRALENAQNASPDA